MTREWKPGDVAMVDGHIALALDERDADGRLSFVYNDSEGDPCSLWVEDSDARPLVVVDPESAKDVARLATAYEEVEGAAPGLIPMTVSHLRMLAALRSLIAPPKPPEPTGLGAVVEDAEGEAWVRYARRYSTAPWVNGTTSVEWEDITAVRILSEGVDQ